MTQSEPLLGRRIGQIRMTGVLGKGGMGTVYAGFHERLERKVAIKLIKADRRMSEKARRRFLREARVLSRLNHPNVCQVHDLLDTAEGDILVLEFVEGVSLRQRIREGLSQREALSIARQLLNVLAAVHRQGIVHRDLKPENIMVQPNGAIKVLDFGIARTTGIEAAGVDPDALLSQLDNEPSQSNDELFLTSERRILTGQGALVGTLRYMSPEQARGETATPASDIYATALIVLEMLTGKPPYPHDIPLQVLLAKVAWGDIEHVQELPVPLRAFVERLTSLAPADRPSARDAADRLDFILRAPQRRKKRRVVTATLALLALLAAGMTIQWARASREAERARRSLAETREVSNFLEELFQLSNPFFAHKGQRSPGQALTVQQLLQRGTRTIQERFAAQPLTRARFMVLLGRIQRNIGHYREAASLFQQATAIRRATLPPNDLRIAEAFRELGEVKRLQTHFKEAEGSLKAARSIEETHPGHWTPGHGDTLESLALLAEDRGQAKQALSMLQHVYELRLAQPDQSPRALALTLQRLGVVENILGRYDEAREHLELALETIQPATGPNHPAVAALLTDLGNLETAAGHLKVAESDYRKGLQIAQTQLSQDHPLRISLITDLANTLDNEGRYQEAAPLYREVLAIRENTVGPNHIETGKVLLNLAMLEHHQGHLAQAERHFQRAVSILERHIGKQHPVTAIAYLGYGALEEDRNRYDRAEQLYSQALAAFQAKLGPEHPYTAMALNNIGEINRLRGRYRKAETYYQRALTIDEKKLGPRNPAVAEIVRGLALTHANLGDTAGAKQLFDRAQSILEAANQPLDQLLADRQQALGARSSHPRSRPTNDGPGQ